MTTYSSLRRPSVVRVSWLSCFVPNRAGSTIAPGNSGAAACRSRLARRSRATVREGCSMRLHFEPKISILPVAQRELLSHLAPSVGLGLVLYGGTAIALHLGHRESVDFDF